MMRWNNTRTYTEEDMIRMQQEAVNRVHEFQTRAQSTAKEFVDVSPADMRMVPDEPEPILFNPTPELSFSEAQAAGGPTQLAGTRVIEADSRVLPQREQPQQHPSDPISGLIEKLGIDTETLLILGLLFLLYNEKADNALLMALAYLLL